MKQDLHHKEFLLFFTKLIKQSNFSDNDNQFIKLEKYVDCLWDLFLWQYKHLYLELFVNFINYNISGEQFIELRYSHMKEFDQLLKELESNFQAIRQFSVDSKAFNFNYIIDQVYDDSDVFVPDILLESIGDDRDADEINKNEFRTRIKEAKLKIQKMMQET